MIAKDNRDKIRKKRRKRNLELKVFILFWVLVVTVLGASSAYHYARFKKEEEKTAEAWAEVEKQKETYTQTMYTKQQLDELSALAGEEKSKEVLDELKLLLESGDGTIHALQAMYPDTIVMVEGNGYRFFDIMPQLQMNGIKNENIVKNEAGELEHYVDGKQEFRKGIDISRFQGDINWDKVRGDGVEFAYIRIGIRGYESGALVLDEKFKENAAGAKKSGLSIGAYFYSQAINVEEAKEEAKFVLDHLNGMPLDLPVVYDVEDVESTNARTKEISQKERTDMAIAFCDTIKEAGYEPMIYGNVKSFLALMEYERLEQYDKWFASYRDVLYFPYKIKVWQYTEKGSVNGIKGDVDMNIAFY